MKIIAVLAAAAALAPTHLNPDPSWIGASYICGAGQFRPTESQRQLVVLPGMGSGGFQVSPGNAEARTWLTYGLRLYHAFYHEDAKAAFARAAKEDPDCALCAAGEAIGLGPTLNFWVSQDDTAKALAAAGRAARLARTPLERDLAEALLGRYAAEPDRLAREKRYGQAMAALADAHPEEPELAALAAHALLVPTNQNDTTGVSQAMSVLERSLKRNPDDTAAIHYYIHASEWAHRPAGALPYAERLESLAPGASHLVHMAAHILFRVGRYEEVAVVDAKAMKVDADYALAMGYPAPLGAQRYYAHNMMFGTAGALMAGDRALALKYAEHTPVAFPADADVFRRAVVDLRGLIALGRYEPRKMLAIDAPPATDPPFHHLFWLYGRGEAFAALGDAAGVLRESQAIDAMKITPGGGIPDLQYVAAKVLAARAAMLKGEPSRAAALYTEAAVRQETALAAIFDPPPWWYPIRRSVAAARLKAGDPRAAAAEARASLAVWPADGLALKVLSEAERKLGDKTAAERDAKRAREAWKGDLRTVNINLL